MTEKGRRMAGNSATFSAPMHGGRFAPLLMDSYLQTRNISEMLHIRPDFTV